MAINVLVFSLFVLLSMSSYSAPIEMAITVDDLPVHGKLPAGATRLEIAKQMLSAFQKHQVPEVYGFINAAKFEFDKDQLLVLKAWREAGYPLGNHTYSHIDINKVSAQDFSANISENEKALKDLNGSLDWKYFRYPYLHEGNELEKRTAVRKFLQEQNYKTAQVTIDFEDWAWNDPFARCLERKNAHGIQWLKTSYLGNAKASLKQAQKLSQFLFKRPIKHILLLHIGAFDAEMLDELLKMYLKNGVKFISLSEAVKDEIYQIDPGIVSERGSELTFQVMQSKSISFSQTGAEHVRYPGKKLASLCL